MKLFTINGVYMKAFGKLKMVNARLTKLRLNNWPNVFVCLFVCLFFHSKTLMILVYCHLREWTDVLRLLSGCHFLHHNRNCPFNNMILRPRPQWESVHFETAYMFSWIVEEEALHHFGERFQKDVISVREFTGFVWTIGGSICVSKICGRCLNPLSPNSHQHQFSPKDIHTMTRD